MEVSWLIINLNTTVERQSYRKLRVTVHLEPVGADEVLLVEDSVVGAKEVEILELKIKVLSA